MIAMCPRCGIEYVKLDREEGMRLGDLCLYCTQDEDDKERKTEMDNYDRYAQERIRQAKPEDRQAVACFYYD